MRHGGKEVAIALLLLAAGSPGTAQDAPASGARQRPFVEKVEVRVRSVLVFATGPGGKPLSAPLTAADLRILENGKPVEVLDVEPVHATSASRPAAPPPPAPASRGAAAAAATLQYLYVDTANLNRRSMKRVTDAVSSHLDGILSIGPLEIVLADATPAVFLPPPRMPPRSARPWPTWRRT